MLPTLKTLGSKIRLVKMFGGIDPGATGAISFNDPFIDKTLTYDMPIDEDRVVIGHVLYRIIDNILFQAHELHITVEKQWARPGMRAKTMNSMMKNYGIVLGVLSVLEDKLPHLTVHIVTPSKWKKIMELKSKKDASYKEKKDDSIKMCINLFPEFSKLPLPENRRKGLRHDLAEARLIAEYTRRITEDVQ